MGHEASGPPVAARRGRPRDEDADAKLRAAALEVYGERGWHGLTIREVCRRAEVSKDSFYARWSNVGDLLGDALVAAIPAADPGDPPANLRELLLEGGRGMAAIFAGPAGLAFRRLTADRASSVEALVRIDEAVYRGTAKRFRERVLEAFRRELRPGGAGVEDVDRLLDFLQGAIYMHVLTARADRSTEGAQALDVYVRRVVDDVLTLAIRPAGRGTST